MTELVSGQNHPWPETRVTVRLHGRADLSALLLGSDAKVRDEQDFVFYNAPHTTGVKWTADAQARRPSTSRPLTCLLRSRWSGCW